MPPMPGSWRVGGERSPLIRDGRAKFLEVELLGIVSRRKSLLASSILCGVMLPAVGAWAQQTSTEEPAQVEEIVVTGSRIARPDLTSSSASPMKKGGRMHA